MGNDFLSSLTDKQLERLYFNILERCFQKFIGGTVFGIDRRTLHVIAPGFSTALKQIEEETDKRHGSK